MLLPYRTLFQSKKLILGSSSATRKLIMATQNVPFECVSSTFEEDLPKESFKSAKEYCEATCDGKAQQLLTRFKKEGREWHVLVVADTIVEFQGKVIEKPMDEQHCVRMLSQLAGKEHNCITAHQVHVGDRSYKFTSQDKIRFFDIEEEVIRAIAKTKDPFTHSGGYAMTQATRSLVAQVKGDHGYQGLQVGGVCQLIIKGLRQMKWI